MTAYVAPSLSTHSWTCVHCDTLAQQRTGSVLVNGVAQPPNWFLSLCQACGEFTVWREGVVIWPSSLSGPPPHELTPELALTVYEEARQIAAVSPRAAAGLLRLALQILVDEIEPGNGTIDQKIGKLVRRGLSAQVQQAMDSLRVIGNEAVHPGTIDVNNPDLVAALFKVHNLIVEQVVANEALVRDLYALVPETKLDGIARRDAQPS